MPEIDFAVMLAKAGKWLLSNPWRIGVMALLPMLAFYHFIRVPGLEHTISKQKTTISTQQTQITDLQGKIKDQNAAIDGWKKATDQAQENQKKALEAADKYKQQIQTVVTKIEKEPIPTPDKECQATLNLLRKYQ